MAWTAPMTATDGQELSAATYNLQIRDNFLELAPAKATASGGFFAVSGVNEVAERHVTSSVVLTQQSTTSATYVDLATVGPRVTVTTGTSALVWFGCEAWSANSDNAAIYSLEITGKLNEDSGHRVIYDGATAANSTQTYGLFHATGLTEGSNTFTMKYRSGTAGVSATFQVRELVVFPM